VGSVAPDLFLITELDYATSRTMGRVISHSLLGAATIDTFLSVALTVFLYPSLVSFVFRLDKEKVREKCRLSVLLVASCLIGCVLHVLIDSLHHEFNPLLHPFITESFDTLVLFNDWVLATIVVHSFFLVLLISILIWETLKGIDGLWERLFVA